MSAIAVYPGSFDPITFGHLDILERATEIMEKVYLTVAINREKDTIFSAEERVAMIQACMEGKAWAKKVEITQFTGLLVEYAKSVGANTLIRGVRQVSDFEYEFRMALMNRRLAPEIETIFLMPREQLTFVSASLVREVAYWGGDLSSFVPEHVAKPLLERLEARKKEK